MENQAVESIIFKESSAPHKLLVIFAHPDDESFGPGGTLIHYANNGAEVHYICATRGEAGEVDAEMMNGHESIGELRTQELLCAAKHLQLTSLHFLNYHDSGMENSPANDNPRCLFQAPVEEVSEKITCLIREIQPQVVLTFDPTGGYFHPDHIQIHKAAVHAFHAASDPAQFPHQLEEGLSTFAPQKLYYTAFPKGFVRLMVKILPLFRQDPTALGRNKDIDLKRIAEGKQTITTKIRVTPHFEEARAAAACHASQGSGGMGRILPMFVQKWLARYDTFTRIEPPVESPNGVEQDFFAGV